MALIDPIATGWNRRERAAVGFLHQVFGIGVVCGEVARNKRRERTAERCVSARDTPRFRWARRLLMK